MVNERGTNRIYKKHTSTDCEEATLGLYDYRARFYDPLPGRFIQPDTIVPDPSNPIDLDRYAYARNNPVRFTDPTGHISQGEENDAEKILKQLLAYEVKIKVDWGMRGKRWQEGLWTLAELQTVLDAVQDLANAMGGTEPFKSNLGGITITQKNMKSGGLGRSHNVTLNANGFSQWTVVHELAHAWGAAKCWKLSKDMQSSLGAGFAHPILHFLNPSNDSYWYDPGSGPPPCGTDANFNAKEYFAESVTAYIYPAEAERRANASNYPYTDPSRGYNYSSFFDTPRGQYIKALMVSSP